MRTYKRKTTRCSYTTEDLSNAAKAVNDEGKSVNAAAKEFGIKRMTLTRFSKILNEGGDSSMGYATPRRVFSPTQEESLKNYLLQMASIFYGYSPKDVRRLAYECSAKFSIEIPPSWTANKMAGKEWLTMFLKRNPELSIRKPEPTSLAEVMDRYGFTAADIWNVDETGVSTVLKPNKIVAVKGKRNVGAMTSGERGTNITVVTAVSALGNAVPPMFVFPRKQFKTHFLNGGPPECIGAGNASGWVTDEEFYQFMQHFIKHVKPSMERPVLLVLDNHSSHLNVETLNLAKENGVVMLSFPPHCSHKLQPLDVSVFGPFKKYCAAAQDAWLRNNPGKTLTIYDIPKIVADSLPVAQTSINIVNGFRKTGIFPYNANIFGEDEFSPSFVTDRPEQETIEPEKDHPEQAVMSSTELNPTPSASTSQAEPKPSPSKKENETIDLKQVFSPEIVRPYPKAGPRKAAKTNRRKRKTAILTDTPEKNALEEQQNKTTKKVKKPKKNMDKKRKKSVCKKILQSSDESGDDDYSCLICCEGYSESLPGESWIQCQACREWAHKKCVPGAGVTFVCVNCNSDNDD
ncbi:uncharacterized protein LOC111692606, partial [Anoplophora glabripennis]|uniref:uncharacterized protein LOC111692606 n=1 Tax=Anoplophora glabripennis TaxID=217634 RepID=UPI000C763DE0